MNKIKIYLHSEKFREPEIIEIDEETPVKEIIIKHHELTGNGGTTDEFEIFIENEDVLKNKEHNCKDAGIEKHSHVHCHQCENVKVELHYNGQVKVLSVRPSTTGAKIHSLIPKKFPAISEIDADKLLLEITDKKYIELNDHIGSFVSYPNCNLKISLVTKPNIQG